MNSTNDGASRLRRNLGLASLSAIAVMMAAPAYAQTEDAPQDEDATTAPVVDDAQDSIVVTGSRISRPNLESTVPVTTITGDEFFQTGRTSVGDVLNQLPALRSTFSQSNSSRFLGTAGLNLLDLRGLGTQRTLVLQNGRRHVAGDILSNAVSPDVNTIPTDLIERVDIVTGGNSAVYGSDAIAGVVNFILKDDYEGVQLRGQGGVSKYGDAGSYYVSALAGTNFADDRGNVALNFEYAHQEDFYASGRPNVATNTGLVTVDTDPSSAVNGSDGIPDRYFYNDIRSSLYTNAGTFLDYQGGEYTIPYIFQSDGTLALQTGTRVGLGPYGSFIGGNGDNFRDGTQLGLSPKLDRYSVNLIGHFEVSEAFVPFVEAKYVQTKSLGNASGPFFFNGGVTGSPRERFYTDNPYLSEQAKGIIRDYYGDFFGATGPGEDGMLGTGDDVDIGDGINDADQYGFTFLKNALDLTNREESAKRETYRFVAGVRGTFNDDWGYEVSANYGEFKENTRILGNVNLQRFLLASDAVDEGLATGGAANGNIVCRASVDPSAAIAYEAAADPDYAAAQLANDVAQCQPVNFFGSGNISDEARNYLLQDSWARGKITQFVLSASMTGDTSAWFELPGGPVGFAIGAEYRRETALYDQDEATAAGMTFYNAIPTFDPPSFEVKELFGELRVPILADTPGFQELTLSGAGRVSDYKGATGTVFAYNGGIDWAPIRDVRFRANYSRAVRAPNLVDLYTPLGQNYTPAPDDPCSLRNIGEGSSTREANCRADGVPAGYDYVYQSSLPYLSGGNPDLKEETSDSYTVGAVIQPSFLPGFSLSVDYYKIVVNDVITSPAAQAILDTCYDASDLDNQFCDLFERAGPGGGPQGEIEGQILNNSLQVVPLNYAKLKVRGIDFEAGYRRDFGELGELNTRLVYTRVLQNDSFLDPTDPGFADQALYELGDPRDAFNWSVDYKAGPLTLGYKMRYIGKMVLNEYEDFFSKQGRDPQNADYANVRFYPSVFIHDIRLDFEANEKVNVYFGVDNVTNQLPPYGLTGAGGGSGIYNNIGRFFYAGAVAKF